MIPFNPTDRIAATLEAQQWNQVLALLYEEKYRISAPIIHALIPQLNAAAEQDMEATDGD